MFIEKESGTVARTALLGLHLAVFAHSFRDSFANNLQQDEKPCSLLCNLVEVEIYKRDTVVKK